MHGTVPVGTPRPTGTVPRMRTPPNVAWVLVWTVAALAWMLVDATLSPSRLIGAALLAALPALLLTRAPAPLRAGLAVGGALVIAAGLVFGAASGATIGLAVGATTVWGAVALARCASDRRLRVVGALIAVVGTTLLLAPSVGPAGPRTAGAGLALGLGWLLGGVMLTRAPDAAHVPVLAVRVGVSLLLTLGLVRTVVDLDAPSVQALLALRRFASLVVPTGSGLVGPTGSGAASLVAAVLPWLVPLGGAVVALTLARIVRDRRRSEALQRSDRSHPGPTAGLTILIAAGLMATALADLVGVNWPVPEGRIAATILWPDRYVETLLWGLLALAVALPRAHAAALPAVSPLSRAVAAASGLVLVTILLAEWRVDGVAPRPALLAVPTVFLGLLVLARGSGVGSGVGRVAAGIALAGVPVLTVGLVAGILEHGPSRSGRRSILPGDGMLLIGGERLAGLLPDPGQLGLVGAAIGLAGALLVLLPRATRAGRWEPVLGWVALGVAAASVVLAEAKGALLALALGVAAAVLAHRIPDVAHRWSLRAGVAAGTLVIAAPFVGAAVLDPTALRPEVWRSTLAALTRREWLVGLGAQPLRMDREFHTRIDSTWGAVQAHNQALELLLIAGIPGLLLMLCLVAALITVGLRLARVAHGWPVLAAVFLVAAGASGPNLTYFGHDLAFVLVAVLVAGVAHEAQAHAALQHVRPRLVRLDDDSASLADALALTWAAGNAAVVAAAGADLPAPIARALAGELALPHDAALIVPTSGSTGTPRAVVLSHAALAASTAASIAALGCAPGERWALALPLRHVAGLQVLARARAMASDVHVVAAPGDPHAIAAAATYAEHIALVPTQLVRCLEAGVDLRRFHTVLVGGGPFPPERAAEARAAGVRIVQSYGMTETCGGCVYDGWPLDGVEIDLQHVDDGSGRIRLRGPMRATGYLGAPPNDTTSFTPDGWFVTDDVGRFAPDGSLEVLGRVDAMINTGGVKVDPTVVETLLRDHPAVVDAAVIAAPDTEWGERIIAIVVPRDPTAPPTLEALRAHVSATLPPTHAPRELVITERIVRDGLGKLSAAERNRLHALRTS